MSRKKKAENTPSTAVEMIENTHHSAAEDAEDNAKTLPTVEPDTLLTDAKSEVITELPTDESSYEEEPQDKPEADDEFSDKASELEEAHRSIEELTEEIKLLKEQIEKLEELKRSQNRILAEIGDFVDLFPEIPIEEIPETVWESVKQGAPLAASYALYEKRMVAEAKRIAEINAKNARRSPGAAGKDTAGEYFSPEDVRRMSRAEVHANYSKIKDSMKKWM